MTKFGFEFLEAVSKFTMHGNDKGENIYIGVCVHRYPKTRHILVYTVFMVIFQILLKGIKEYLLIQCRKVSTISTL